VLQCVAVCCSVLQCVAVCCGVLQCVAVCCSVSQCVAVCCNVLQCVAVCCSVLQCVAACCSIATQNDKSFVENPPRYTFLKVTATHCNTLQHTATHYSTLLHTAAHCCTLQHTATHCRSLQHTAAHCNTLLDTKFKSQVATQFTVQNKIYFKKKLLRADFQEIFPAAKTTMCGFITPVALEAALRSCSVRYT